MAVALLTVSISVSAFSILGEGAGKGLLVGLFCAGGFLWVDSRVRAAQIIKGEHYSPRETIWFFAMVLLGIAALVGLILLGLVILG